MRVLPVLYVLVLGSTRLLKGSRSQLGHRPALVPKVKCRRERARPPLLLHQVLFTIRVPAMHQTVSSLGNGCVQGSLAAGQRPEPGHVETQAAICISALTRRISPLHARLKHE